MNLSDGSILVRLARTSIETFFSKKPLDLSKAKRFSDDQGVFVTLNKFKALRGCIGYPEPIMPLYKAVVQAARAAALQDPRFPQVMPEEMADITVEVSVLTVPEKIIVETPKDYLDKIEIGKDGLIIRSSYGSGLLLPIVFVDYESTPKTALEMTCQKAGLPKDAWMESENKIFKFQSIVFAEKNPEGEIERRL